jgi:hypothetical protein
VTERRRHAFATRLMGPPSPANLREKTPAPTFKISEQDLGAGYDHPGRCEALGFLVPYVPAGQNGEHPGGRDLYRLFAASVAIFP